MIRPAAMPSSGLEQKLDAAYSRVLKATILSSAAAVVAAWPVAGWRSSVGVALGALVGTMNLVWLHQGAEMMVRRMMAANEGRPAEPSAAEAGPPAEAPTEPGTPSVETGMSAIGTGAEAALETRAEAASGGPSKLRVMLFFPLRYFVVIMAVYAILKGYPGLLVSFIVGLALPTLALMAEGIYEAIMLQQDRP